MSDRRPSPSPRRDDVSAVLVAVLGVVGVTVAVSVALATVSADHGGPLLLAVDEWLSVVQAYPLATAGRTVHLAVMALAPAGAILTVSAYIRPDSPTDPAVPTWHSGGRRGEHPAT